MNIVFNHRFGDFSPGSQTIADSFLMEFDATFEDGELTSVIPDRLDIIAVTDDMTPEARAEIVEMVDHYVETEANSDAHEEYRYWLESQRDYCQEELNVGEG